ncbi:MAG: hypothetical protein CBB87_10560 [Micavibrio sp. TMED27]|nr:hypothetical protein [Micavibrio sp.]OUT90194.1 MAG: hypothetical protein CBB87_10560 [Micavibrio sp. TMED27]|tara:strand:- start:638 stop:1042 length:405 start_codon:yes stop_codon:yes gene_type:complete
MNTPPLNSNKNNKIPTPFSLRLTFEERAALEQEAGDEPLGAYIRKKLLGNKRKPRRRRSRTRKPLKDEKALGELLGKLGESRLASNVNQLAKAANSGSLPVTPDTEKALQTACDDVRAMRMLLMQALGYYSSEV